MSGADDAPGIGGAWFAKIAPFHIFWSADLGAFRMSEKAARYLHAGQASLADATLKLLHPYTAVLQASFVRELTEMTLYIGYEERPDRYLRGEIIWVEEYQTWLFSGLPPLSAVDDLKELGVSLRDLHFHLGVADFLIAHQAANVSLREALSTNTALESTVADLRSTQNALVQQERFKALGEMVSGIAHDFGNLLVPIMTYSTLLKEEADMSEEESAELLEVIHTASSDAADLIERLRRLYKPELHSTSFVQFDLSRLVQDALALASPRWSRGIRVSRELPRGLTVVGSEPQVRQAMLNLLVNAGDAMPEGGDLSVTTGGEGETVWVTLTDTGSGMSPDVLERCREPLFSTKGDRGTGLGLAMVANCALRHGGEVQIESTVGNGTTVRFILARESTAPAPLGAPREEAAVVGATAPPPSRSADDARRVLLVDDEAFVLEALTHAAELAGLSVVTAEDGRDALELMSETNFDAVVMDVDMPEMRGDELVLHARAMHPTLPLFLYTGRPDVVPDASAQAATSVLAKPMAAGEVIARVLEAMPEPGDRDTEG